MHLKKKKKRERNQGNLFLCIAKMYLSKFHYKNRLQCRPARNGKKNDNHQNKINGFCMQRRGKIECHIFYDLLEQRVKKIKT